MTGSTLIHEPVEARLRSFQSIDELDEFVALDLTVLSTIDFQMMLEPSGISWVGDEPVFLDEEGGAAIFKVAPASIKKIISIKTPLDAAQAADLEKIRAFVVEHGPEHIYELATF